MRILLNYLFLLYKTYHKVNNKDNFRAIIIVVQSRKTEIRYQLAHKVRADKVIIMRSTFSLSSLIRLSKNFLSPLLYIYILLLSFTLIFMALSYLLTIIISAYICLLLHLTLVLLWYIAKFHKIKEEIRDWKNFNEEIKWTCELALLKKHLNC